MDIPLELSSIQYNLITLFEQVQLYKEVKE